MLCWDLAERLNLGGVSKEGYVGHHVRHKYDYLSCDEWTVIAYK